MTLDKKFAGDIPTLYDEYLVPLIFDRYAEELAQRVARLAPGDLLETAAGSGVVARAVAPQLGADARYVVSDLNQPMLDRAIARQGDDARISWRQADALDLPFADGSFDAVVCQFGVMFFPDRVAGMAEARRVLKPGGSFIFNSWDRIEVNEFADVVTRSAGELFPEDPPRFLARTPHGYHDVEQIRMDVRAAGFSAATIDTIEATSAAPTARHAAVAYCEGTPLRNEIEERDPALLEQVKDRATKAIADRFGQGVVEARIQAHVVTATKQEG
jgi:ubiquinone/menaquinone biosynthesis C-methylase UbiE